MMKQVGLWAAGLFVGWWVFALLGASVGSLFIGLVVAFVVHGILARRFAPESETDVSPSWAGSNGSLIDWWQLTRDAGWKREDVIKHSMMMFQQHPQNLSAGQRMEVYQALTTPRDELAAHDGDAYPA